MSDRYKLNIVPEPVKAKYFGGLDYYRKYRIYKEIREIEATARKHTCRRMRKR